MPVPDYRKGSIVNLMSSVAKMHGITTEYKPLRSIDAAVYAKSKNVVLLVIDGLGYEYLRKYGKRTLLYQHLKGKLTAVFPPTTAASVTTFHTGQAPQEHGLTGWFMHLKELGTVTAMLPFMPRFGKILLDNVVAPEKILDQKPLHDRFKVDCYILLGENIIRSAYTRILSGKAKRVGYRNLDGMFQKLQELLRRKKKKYVYAYWPGFDSLLHEHGPTGRKVLNHLRRLDKKLSRFLRMIEGTDTTLIITADHGLIGIPAKNRVLLEDHPKLSECLTLPLCGESRAAYCYVRPAKARQFERYVKQHLKRQCKLYRSESLVKKGYFGLGKPHPKLLDRIGDYILIMKENYAIKDFLINQKQTFYKGVHGGLSNEEMFVPVIVIRK